MCVGGGGQKSAKKGRALFEWALTALHPVFEEITLAQISAYFEKCKAFQYKCEIVVSRRVLKDDFG